MTYKHKIKCLTCDLHFVALSWREDWRPTVCPECGTVLESLVPFRPGAFRTEVGPGPYLHWLETDSREISYFVPGAAHIVEVRL